MKTIPGIAVCIWDFDGTLYRQQQGLWDSIRASEIRVVMKYTGWSQVKAKEEFYKIYNVVTPSGTKTTSILAGIPNAQASLESSDGTPYAAYLKKDEKLNVLFAKLAGYTHYMLVNGSRDSVAQGAATIGLDTSVFTEVVTSEIVGETKPGTKGFLYIMEKTGLPPEGHLMIGDREAVDLVPAKSLGLHTCLVWSDTKSNIADVTLAQVYDIVNVLG